jgi:hypothetical protein
MGAEPKRLLERDKRGGHVADCARACHFHPIVGVVQLQKEDQGSAIQLRAVIREQWRKPELQLAFWRKYAGVDIPHRRSRTRHVRAKVSHAKCSVGDDRTGRHIEVITAGAGHRRPAVVDLGAEADIRDRYERFGGGQSLQGPGIAKRRATRQPGSPPSAKPDIAARREDERCDDRRATSPQAGVP